jgi:TolB protein
MSDSHVTRGLVLIRLSVMIALSAAATLILTSSAHATFPGRDGRLAYQGLDDTTGRLALYTVGPHGQRVRQLTHFTDGDLELPDWSPDGKTIAFDSDHGGGGIHIFTIRSDGTGLTQVTSGDGSEYGPAWSPDGMHLAIDHIEDGVPDSIFILDPTTGAMRQLTSNPFAATGGFDGGPQYSPDGTQIAFARIKAFRAHTALSAVFVVNVDGTHLRRLTPFKTNSANPDWSPDGSRLVFNDRDDADAGGSNVYTIKPDGTCLRKLTHDPTLKWYQPNWSPSGRKIVATRVSTTDGSVGFWTMSANGTHIKPLLQSDDFKNQADWQARSLSSN